MVREYTHLFVCLLLRPTLRSLIQLPLEADEVAEIAQGTEAVTGPRVPMEVEDDHLTMSPSLILKIEIKDMEDHRLGRSLVLISCMVSVLGVQVANMITPRMANDHTVPEIAGHRVATKEGVFLVVHQEGLNQNVFCLRRVIANLAQIAGILTQLVPPHLAHLKREIQVTKQQTALRPHLFDRGGPRPSGQRCSHFPLCCCSCK
jgi:hypothetical protein